MAAASTDLLIEVGTPGTATTLSAPGYTVGNTSLTVGSTTNWATSTGVIFAMDEIDTAGVRVDGTYNVYAGVVSSATSITSVSHVTGSGTDRNYSAGATTRVYIVVASEITRRLVQWGLAHADQDGTLKAGAVDVATVLADSVVTAPKLAVGIPVQVVSTNFSAVATGTTTIPADDTIPQITEGTEFMTQAITPKSATNRLLIRTVLQLSHGSVANANLIAALFQDSTAGALSVSIVLSPAAQGVMNLVIEHDMVAGTTSATTFRVRGGSSNVGTVTFNGSAGARLFGATTTKSSITITEYRA